MVVKFYTFYPLQDILRTTFELPAWPYTDNPEFHKQFTDYLQELKVFQYSDSIAEWNGRDVNYPTTFKLDIDPEKPFLAFVHEAVLDDNNFTVKDYPFSFLNDPRNKNLKKVNDFYGDTKAWHSFNIPGDVTFWNPTSGIIKFTERTELIKENCTPKCMKKTNG